MVDVAFRGAGPATGDAITKCNRRSLMSTNQGCPDDRSRHSAPPIWLHDRIAELQRRVEAAETAVEKFAPKRASSPLPGARRCS